MAAGVRDLLSSIDCRDLAEELYRVVEDLYPICRSITGEGVRTTLRSLQEDIPLELVEVPTGTEVFDWTVPREWNIADAYVKNSAGRRVIDFQAQQPSRCELQRPNSGEADPGRAYAAPPYPSGSSRMDTVSNVLLQPDLGVLP